MNRSIPVSAAFCTLTLFQAVAPAQETPPTHIDVQPLIAKERQERSVITALQDQITALERAAVLLSKDPADQTALASISSMLAASKRQLEAAKAAYEYEYPEVQVPAAVFSHGRP